MRLNLNGRGCGIDVDFSQVQILQPETDYENLANKPYINGVELSGNIPSTDMGLGIVYYRTTEEWNAQSSLISEKGVVYIYSDASSYLDDENIEHDIAGIKIGDGTSYLIDLPFMTEKDAEKVSAHIADTVSHVSQADRDAWDSKVYAFVDENDAENLILSPVAQA